MNGDNYLDLITANYAYPYGVNVSNPRNLPYPTEYGDVIRIYPGTAGGLIASPTVIYSGQLGHECIAVGDYDHDQDLDIAVGTAYLGNTVAGMAGNDGLIFILKNNGGFNFTREQMYSNLTPLDTRAIKWVDLDCDGDLDLAALSTDGCIRFYQNSNSSFLTEPSSINVGMPGFTWEAGMTDDTGPNPFFYNWNTTTVFDITAFCMEFGDFDRDGDLDLLSGAKNFPQIYWNNMDPTMSTISWGNLFDASHVFDYNPACNGGSGYPIEGHENIYCASIGYYHGPGSAGEDTLAIAIGSFSYASPEEMQGTHWCNEHHRYEINWDQRGNNVYAIERTSPPEGLRHVWISEYKSYYRDTNMGEPDNHQYFQLVTDIQWADVNNDHLMDLVTCAYPTALDVNLADPVLNWSDWNGRERIYLNTGNGFTIAQDYLGDWQSEGNDLSTSLALGDIRNTQTLNDTLWIHRDDSKRVRHVRHFPFRRAVNLQFYNGAVPVENPIEISPIVSYDYQNGWISVQRGSNFGPANWDRMLLTYTYSTYLDLAVGNDGPEAVYYSGSSAGSYTSQEKSIPVVPYAPGTNPHLYTEPVNLGPQMDSLAAVGLGIGDQAYPGDRDQHCPNLKTVRLAAGPQTLLGHYYWRVSDEAVDAAESRDHTVVLAGGAGSEWLFGNWTPDSASELQDLFEEQLLAYNTAAVVNRYRRGGILGQNSSFNWDSDWGIHLFTFFANEPNGFFFPMPNRETIPDSGHPAIQSLARQYYYCYQMLHAIGLDTMLDSLYLVSSNFGGVQGIPPQETAAVPATNYLLALNSVDLAETPGIVDSVLADYIDIILQQMYLDDATVTPPAGGPDEWPDPFQHPDYPANYILDYFEGNTLTDPDYEPVLEYWQEKPFMTFEWQMFDTPCGINRALSFNSAIFNVRNKQAPNSSEQPLCKYSWMSFCYGGASTYKSEAMIRALDAQAALLNGTRPTLLYEGGSGGYDRGYHILNSDNYPSASTIDQWIVPNQQDAYDFVYHEPDPLDLEGGRFVHCVRSAYAGPTGTENLYLKRTNYNGSGRVNVWDGNGFYVDRDVDIDYAPSAYDYIPIYAGESDSLMQFVEEYTVEAVTDVHQGIQLFKGWNLVSLNIEPPYTAPPAYPEMQDIFGSASWFDKVGSVTDQVYTFTDDDQWYPTAVNSNQWPWEMEQAFMINMQSAQHLWELEADDWFGEGVVEFTPHDAWDDSLDPNLVDQVNYWFFLGFSKSRQVEVLPADESIGPFFDLYDLRGQNYGNRSLKIVKSDDGRVFLPNYDALGRDIDQIGYLEPGRGYCLGFMDPLTVQNWPFCMNLPEVGEESVGGGLPKGQESSHGTASLTPGSGASPVHFQFKSRTQWWYPVMVDTIVLEGVTPEPGDEIGIFDGQTCVGAAAYTGEYPLVLAAWKDDIATPQETDGYTPGQGMTFKFFDVSENTEITFTPPPGVQSLDDDPVAPTHSGFGAGAFARRSLVDGITQVIQLPTEYSLGQNYPNPFNVQTVIPIALPQRSQVTVTLYNLMGQKVAEVFQGVQNAGQARIHFDASFLPSGMYFYRVEASGLERGGSFADAGKMLLLK